jgi:hypothetical protein
MRNKIIFLVLIILTVLLAACSNPQANTGTLMGKVTIGPFTPVQQAGETPAALPAEAYTSRGIEILQGGHEEIYKTVHFNADGTYSVTLPEGNYIVRSISTDVYQASGLPTSVKITAGHDTVLDLNIDTGIR